MNLKRIFEKKSKFEILFFLGFLFFAFLAFFLLSGIIQNKYPDMDSPTRRGFFVPSTNESALTGMNLERNTPVDKPIAVIVENYTPIRGQQAGLEEAAIVYESLAEGGITRLLAIFTSEPVDLIGPIRSARPYFVDWAQEYRAAFVHIGGSPASLEKLDNTDEVLDVEEKIGETTIWRNSKYLAPHNAYSSTDNVLEAMSKTRYKNKLNTPRFKFKDKAEIYGDIQVITIDFWNQPYLVKYAFDTEDGLYERYNGGQRHGYIKPANIIVQYTTQEVIDDDLRRRIQTRGTGDALVFRDGEVIEAYWEKDASVNTEGQPVETTFTRFYDMEGNEIELNKGQTWIEVVPYGRAVNYF